VAVANVSSPRLEFLRIRQKLTRRFVPDQSAGEPSDMVCKPLQSFAGLGWVGWHCPIPSLLN
jgi:hypothetical protein